MANAHVAHSSSRQSRDRRESIGIVTSRTRHLSWLPLTLVVLSLAGLAVAPLVLQQRTSYMRDDIRIVGEPGRLLLGELRLGLARELALAQRFTVSRDRSHLFEFQRTAARASRLWAATDCPEKIRGLNTVILIQNADRSRCPTEGPDVGPHWTWAGTLDTHRTMDVPSGKEGSFELQRSTSSLRFFIAVRVGR